MKRYIISQTLWVITLFAAIGPAQAQEEGEAKTYSLPQFIETGLKNNYGLRIVRNEEQIKANETTRANAGYLPEVNLSAGYDGALNSSNAKSRANGSTTSDRNVFNQGFSAGINAEWTIFDGFKIQTDYKRLQQLRLQGETQTRIAIEDYVADLTSEYYNFIQQRIRMRNLHNAVALSKERLRIVFERYTLGSASRLELQQARVDFNADSAQSLKQLELLATSRIRLYELMAVKDIAEKIVLPDTAIIVNDALDYDALLQATLRTNASLINAAQNRTLAELDFKKVAARDYPYIKLAAGYNYSHNEFGSGSNRRNDSWGPDFGVKVGYKLFDGKRSMERKNARLDIENAELAQKEIEQLLRADLADLWQAYRNNLRLLALERENLITAQENHYIASERYLLGNLPGIEMREAQQSLLDAEERILVAEYNTKVCEISLNLISGGIMSYIHPVK